MSQVQQQVIFTDPNRIPITLATGPISITNIGDLVVITFSQAIPRIEGTGAGWNQTHLDAVVVSRIGLPRKAACDVVQLIQSHAIAAAPVAGSA
jgi:hypothetical protein